MSITHRKYHKFIKQFAWNFKSIKKNSEDDEYGQTQWEAGGKSITMLKCNFYFLLIWFFCE